MIPVNDLNARVKWLWSENPASLAISPRDARSGAAAGRADRWRSTELRGADGFDALPATTHHAFYADFQKAFPQVQVVRDVRFVENPLVSSAGGLTSGIDLALRIVERFGLQTASGTANYLEYKRSAIATRWPAPAAM